MLAIALLIAVLSQTAGESPTGPPARYSTVCEVLKDDPVRLNGSVISVRGILSISDEGAWLFGDCEKHLVTRGVTWSNVLWLETDETDAQAVRSVKNMWKRIRTLHADPRNDSVYVTLVGRLETEASMNAAIVPRMDGTLARAGFGHLGAAPAQIVIQKATDITVVHAQADKH